MEFILKKVDCTRITSVSWFGIVISGMVTAVCPSVCASIIIIVISFTSLVSLLIKHCIILNRPFCILPRYIVCSSCNLYTYLTYNICLSCCQYVMCADEWYVQGCNGCAFVCEDQDFPYVSIVIMVSVWLSYVSCTKLSVSFCSTCSSVTSSAQVL